MNGFLGAPAPFEGEDANPSFLRLIQTSVKKLGALLTPLTEVNSAVVRADEVQVNTVGDAAVAGTATLVAGTETVLTSKVKTGSIIQLTGVTNTNAGYLSVGTIVNGVSFVISSSSGTDVRNVYWEIKNPKV